MPTDFKVCYSIASSNISKTNVLKHGLEHNLFFVLKYFTCSPSWTHARYQQTERTHTEVDR